MLLFYTSPEVYTIIGLVSGNIVYGVLWALDSIVNTRQTVLHGIIAEIDQVCNERIENIVSAMAKQEGVTEAFKAADQIEWVRRMNSIRNRAEEIVLHELVYDL